MGAALCVCVCVCVCFCVHHRAMGGSVEFKTALTERLGVMQPSKQAVDDFLAKHGHKVTKGTCAWESCPRSHAQRELCTCH